jgi:hypothetical protein
MSNFIDIEYLKIVGSNAFCYRLPEFSNSGSKSIDVSSVNLMDNNVKGRLSINSIKKIRNNVNTWIEAIDGYSYINGIDKNKYHNKISFCTLTLPYTQQHSDIYIKRNMYNRFDIEIKRKSKVKSNIWVTEQQKNSNIHFHILYSGFIHWDLVRSTWNKILKDNNYIDLYRSVQLDKHKNGFKLDEDKLKYWSAENQLKAYNKGMKEDWQDPNSTDIHNLNKINNVGNYITKYMTKNNSESSMSGRLWGRTDTFMNNKNFVSSVDSEINNILKYGVNRGNLREIKTDNCIIYKGFSFDYLKNTSKDVYSDYLNNSIKNYENIYI